MSDISTSKCFVVRSDVDSREMERILNSTSHDAITNFVDYFLVSARDTLTNLADNFSEDAYKIFSTPNAGGTSIVSESLSFEIFRVCYGAKLLKTETEVCYFPEGGSMTDYVMCIFNQTVAVSVTRAIRYGGIFATEDAVWLLEKKLKTIRNSTRNSEIKWSRQILHVWCLDEESMYILIAAWIDLPDDCKHNSVLMVSLMVRDNDYKNVLFYNPPKIKKR